MNTQDFVKLWKSEKDKMLSLYTKGNEETSVSHSIKSMNLSEVQNETMNNVVNEILTDTFYSLLLGLDGSANIGGTQQTYKIHDESGNLISTVGEIEAEAWEQFQN